MELIERLRSEKPHWSDEQIDAVYDRVNEKLIENSEFGQTRAAVWGMIRMQTGWVFSDFKRMRTNEDGSPKNHPRGATSLDAEIHTPDGGVVTRGELVPAPDTTRPDRIVEGREELQEILAAAREGSRTTEYAVVGGMVGYKPVEIAELCGQGVNAVHKGKSVFVRKRTDRFVTLYRADEEGAVGDGQ